MLVSDINPDIVHGSVLINPLFLCRPEQIIRGEQNLADSENLAAHKSDE